MNGPDRIRRAVAVELSVLAVLTVAFLIVFPDRPILADVGLALFALTVLALNTRYTRKVVWGQFPPASDRRSRMRRAYLFAGLVTGAGVIGLFVTGLALGYVEGGWEEAVRRVGNWRILLAVAVYLPWALLQQTLFQFYLLGRLRTVFPVSVAVTCTGIGYALVHLPDLAVTVVTAVAGVCWTYLYERYRVLVPLALSHAILGAAFYYWVHSRDLIGEWAAGL